MILTDEEKRMRDGAEGAATAAAMDLLIRYGDALACDRLCDVRNVAATMTQPSPVKERLVREGGWDKAFAVINLDCDTDIEVPAMRVPTCQLQHGFGPDARGVVPYPAQRIELQQDAESFYGRRGVNILATCTPYQGTRVFATDSAKQAHYLPAILGIEAWFGTLEDSVDAAVTGRWRGRLP
jgi:predicted aconitase